MKELWKDIPNYEGIYQVSNFGNVRNKEKIISQFNNKGYMCVSLYKSTRKNLRVHRLVAEVFIENPDNKREVNHIDGNKRNNKVTNLEWVTSRENKIHAVNNGLNKQCIKIYAYKNNTKLESNSIAQMYYKIKKIENINCKEKTFKENVRRALITHGLYYGYSFERQVVL